ncbi:myelin-oligodendrocyte glycoprotein-like isoform X2 [Denticeps clupeoides]|uniref:myelin-oligodendrocyte glycoprotein-like isoform X2 n=1 Tax=Denticeps clupeoides TaxID=299321 RepID=UPI0010A4DFAF|nr:myelin-oligodendrocyte glycoprotein-like isoform X2 [Denticeps clupeoides]
MDYKPPPQDNFRRWKDSLLFCILLSSGLVSLSTPAMEKVTQGQPAVLPCHLPAPQPRLEATLVYWQTSEDKVVHMFNRGREEYEHQHHSYVNRTTLFPEELPTGNFSLQINPVKVSDNFTTFRCLCGSIHDIREVNRTTLLVEEPVVPTSPPNSSAALPAVAVAVLIVLAVVCFLIVRKCLSFKTDKGNAQETHDNTNTQPKERGENSSSELEALCQTT